LTRSSSASPLPDAIAVPTDSPDSGPRHRSSSALRSCRAASGLRCSGRSSARRLRACFDRSLLPSAIPNDVAQQPQREPGRYRDRSSRIGAKPSRLPSRASGSGSAAAHRSAGLTTVSWPITRHRPMNSTKIHIPRVHRVLPARHCRRPWPNSPCPATWSVS
jgi:hypothetical protein